MIEASIHSVSPIDENHLLYGNYIGLQYAFTDGLDADILAKSVAVLISQFPALSGRYQAKHGTLRLSDQPVSLTYETHPHNLNETLLKSGRPNFVHEPRRKDVLNGRALLSTFTLTTFNDGGMIFGVAISHVLTDAAGYHLILRHFGDIYTAISLGNERPEFVFHTALNAFKFGNSRSKQKCLADLKRRALPKPMPIKGIMGGLVKTLIIKAMDKSLSHNQPVKIHFTAEEISRLKKTVLAESGEDWISTNTALSAHFTSVIAKLSYGDDLKNEIQIGQLLDLRNRYFQDTSYVQAQYVGNAILIHIDKTVFPKGLQNTSRGALARYFKQRQAKTTATDVKDRLDLLADCLAHGYTNPELDVKQPIISLNNQSKMPVYDVNFSGQRPARIYPQDVGDNIMFFPAYDGGIEVYIRDLVNPGGQQKLLSPEWQNHIYNA
ncbi:acyltransferase [Hellea balneolensis]|uniref:acyltransferase n=1 Tax=Hellea balneolensis TaxID=287478 RepID=UPI0004037FC3|nr:acyltransferase [Hellea balneolensis]